MAGTGHGGGSAAGDGPVAGVGEAVTAVFRQESGRLTAALVRVLGDFDLAEEVVQDALLAAWQQWPDGGVPDRPAAWLWTVARRRAVDLVRRDVRLRDKLALIAAVPEPDEPADNRLDLLFTCCHPALSPPSQVALTLRTVCGLSTAEIAGAFLVPESTITQRLTRARRKIAAAGIPYRVPAGDELPARLAAVLAVIYLLSNEGYLSRAADHPQRHDLSDDARWLAELLAGLMPAEPEVLGLLALIRLHRARGPARFDPNGRLILLADQDRDRWDQAEIAAAGTLLVRAGRMRRPGPYQLQAAIVACHAEAPSWARTDWPQILLLYDELLRHQPSPVVRLHRAVALAEVTGAAPALAEVDALDAELRDFHLFHATRAELLRRLDRGAEAREADSRALALAANPAERALLARRLDGD